MKYNRQDWVEFMDHIGNRIIPGECGECKESEQDAAELLAHCAAHTMKRAGGDPVAMVARVLAHNVATGNTDLSIMTDMQRQASSVTPAERETARNAIVGISESLRFDDIPTQAILQALIETAGTLAKRETGSTKAAALLLASGATAILAS